MKIGVYSPYLDTAGGGEKYMLTIAECLSKNNEVNVFLDNHLFEIGKEKILNSISKLHDLDLSKVNFIKAPFGKNSNLISRVNFLKSYDLMFFLTDGSIFYSSAKKNILHIQSPINNKKSVKQKINLSSWDEIIYNSKFTAENCQKSWPVKSKIVYPPVDIKNIKPFKKEKVILTVGFFSPSRNKKQKELIRTFKNMVDDGLKGWKLQLAGGVSEEDMKFIDELKILAKNYPIEFYPNVLSFDLHKLYGTASIYWHAAGLNETDPTRMEHFGISTVEAMAGGAIPVVIKKGGQIEIVEESVSGFLWDSESELISKTKQLMDNDNLMKKMSLNAVKRSELFSKEKFIAEIKQIAND